jgi:hypothetical protein
LQSGGNITVPFAGGILFRSVAGKRARNAAFALWRSMRRQLIVS